MQVVATKENYSRLRRQAKRIVNQVAKTFASINKRYNNRDCELKKLRKAMDKDFKNMKRRAYA